MVGKNWMMHGAVLAAHALVFALGPSMAGAQVAQPSQALPNFVDVYEQQGAAVVSILVASNAKAGPGGRRFNLPEGADPEDLPEPFRRFFQQPNPRGGGQGQAPERDRGPRQTGGGSGFIISAEGYVVTNHHVVDGADELTVKLTDRREFKAKVVGSDSRTDTALLKIEATGLPFVKIGDPSKLKVGEWIVAIGQPFGLENTLTKGVVSAKGRNVGDRDVLAAFIQHDAAVNPGNSGGPLFNLRGEVVGMNSMIFTRSGAFSGLSFAVPIDQAMDVVKQLQATGKIQRGKIGVAIGPVSKDLAESFGLPRAQGALVSTVEKDSPAEKAGVKTGDIVLKFDSKPVVDSSDLPRIVTSVKPGTKAPMEVWRDGKTITVNVQVGESKDPEKVADAGKPKAKSAEAPKNNKTARIGLAVSELTADEKKEMGVKSGLRIEEIRGRVRALEDDDVILAVIYKGQTTEVSTVDQLNKALAKADKGGTVTFQVRRVIRDAPQTLFIPERLQDD